MSDWSYPWKTQPFEHQRKWWEETRAKQSFAVLWEQGTGKSKLTVDTAAYLYMAGEIDCLVVVAPNGVHRNWIVNEVPTHMPTVTNWRGLSWQSNKAATVRAQQEAKELLHHRGLAVLAMSYDAVMTTAGDTYLQNILKARKALLVLDESARIKNPAAKRTTRIMARGKGARFRRILTGTPIANSPFDVFSQFGFLDPDVWVPIGCRTFTAFKTYFGVWAERYDPRSGRKFRELLRYKNLDKLAEITAKVSTRVTKKDVLDLPDKVYTKRYFELAREQAKHYNAMRDSFIIQHQAGEATALLAITQLLRFQQLTSGFVPLDDGNILKLDDNPRLKLLEEIVEDTTGKMIIWAKFTQEINDIIGMLAANGVEAVRYDGQTSAEDRAAAIESFQNGSARAFVANPSAAGEGLTLHAATTVVYYSNSFKLTERLQSEDRAHRIGQKHPVLYIDIVGTDTIDEQIVEALRGKLDIASVITGDKLKEWI